MKTFFNKSSVNLVAVAVVAVGLLGRRGMVSARSTENHPSDIISPGGVDGHAVFLEPFVSDVPSPLDALGQRKLVMKKKKKKKDNDVNSKPSMENNSNKMMMKKKKKKDDTGETIPSHDYADFSKDSFPHQKEKDSEGKSSTKSSSSAQKESAQAPSSSSKGGEFSKKRSFPKPNKILDHSNGSNGSTEDSPEESWKQGKSQSKKYNYSDNTKLKSKQKASKLSKESLKGSSDWTASWKGSSSSYKDSVSSKGSSSQYDSEDILIGSKGSKGKGSLIIPTECVPLPEEPDLSMRAKRAKRIKRSKKKMKKGMKMSRKRARYLRTQVGNLLREKLGENVDQVRELGTRNVVKVQKKTPEKYTKGNARMRKKKRKRVDILMEIKRQKFAKAKKTNIKSLGNTKGKKNSFSQKVSSKGGKGRKRRGKGKIKAPVSEANLERETSVLRSVSDDDFLADVFLSSNDATYITSHGSNIRTS